MADGPERLSTKDLQSPNAHSSMPRSQSGTNISDLEKPRISAKVKITPMFSSPMSPATATVAATPSATATTTTTTNEPSDTNASSVATTTTTPSKIVSPKSIAPIKKTTLAKPAAASTESTDGTGEPASVAATPPKAVVKTIAKTPTTAATTTTPKTATTPKVETGDGATTEALSAAVKAEALTAAVGLKPVPPKSPVGAVKKATTPTATKARSTTPVKDSSTAKATTPTSAKPRATTPVKDAGAKATSSATATKPPPATAAAKANPVTPARIEAVVALQDPDSSTGYQLSAAELALFADFSNQELIAQIQDLSSQLVSKKTELKTMKEQYNTEFTANKVSSENLAADIANKKKELEESALLIAELRKEIEVLKQPKPTVPAAAATTPEKAATATTSSAANGTSASQLVPTLDATEIPEKCSGYLLQEDTEGKYERFYYMLEFGILCVYAKEESAGSQSGQEEINVMDLEKCTLSFPGESRILLQPFNENESNILLQETNIYEFNKWEVALHHHLTYTNPGVKFPRANTVNKKTRLDLIDENGNDITSGKAVVVEADEALVEYTDKRGIKFSTKSVRQSVRAPKNRYADQTLEILREQLRKDGKTPLEFIPLPEIKTEISALFEKANNGIEYEESRLDYLLTCMDLNPEYRAEKDAETKQWRNEMQPFIKECLKTMRQYIPPHVFSANLNGLIETDKMPVDLAKRILAKRCLWLIRVTPADISKMHIAELNGRFNPEAQGLDIIELAAIFSNVPEKFANDDVKGSKERWRLSIEECLKNYYQQYKKNTLAKLKMRAIAYKDVAPIYSANEEYHTMNTTVGDAFSSSKNRESLRMIRKPVPVLPTPANFVDF